MVDQVIERILFSEEVFQQGAAAGRTAVPTS